MAYVPTFKPVIMPGQQRADKTFNVKIRVTFKRKYRILATNLTASVKDVDRYGQLRGNVYAQANEIIRQMHAAIAELNWFDFESMDVDDIVAEIRKAVRKRRSFSLDFFEYAETIIAKKKPGTAATYRTAINSFGTFLGTQQLDINDISVPLLKKYVDYVDNLPKKSRDSFTTSKKKKGLAAFSYCSKLSSIYAEACEDYNEDDNLRIKKNPFTKLRIEAEPSVAKISKSPEFIQKIIDSRQTASAPQRLALDIYLISFGLMGANPADMMKMTPDDAGIISYERTKTRDRRADRAEMKVRIEPCVAHIVDRYRDQSGKLLFNFSGRWSSPSALNNFCRYYFRQWAEANGEQPFTIYSARHTWATLGRSNRVGLSKSLIDECLAHSTNKLVDVYAERDWSILWEANKKVLNIFDWNSTNK